MKTLTDYFKQNFILLDRCIFHMLLFANVQVVLSALSHLATTLLLLIHLFYFACQAALC